VNPKEKASWKSQGTKRQTYRDVSMGRVAGVCRPDSVSLFLYQVLTQGLCKLMEDLEKGAAMGGLTAFCVGRIDLGTRRVAGAPTPAAASKSTFIDSYVIEK
jgi:hypothetical protein